MQTVYAYGENLTVITLPPLGEGEGNIHSGGTPPWLLDEQGNENPTIKKAPVSKKRKFNNSKKLGSNNFKEKSGEENEEWLPNFGRVWNSGPRRFTKREFREEQQFGAN